VPAAFITHLPVQILRDFDVPRLAAVLGFSLGALLVAVIFFGIGLRRYESGNLVTLRG
jgi:ABC-2 type transport system permease protein